ncbi:unannotated protein [freshwater metagenome]|uniref:Unannotated protein n=1 Tax=freshwater metagenome TaxID=449393 RepID=A0A6J7PXI7_9ZZZZ
MTAVGRVAAIAGGAGTTVERAETVLEELRELVPFVAAEICDFDPVSGLPQVLASTGYSDHVLDNLHSPEFIDLMTQLNLLETGRPVRMRDLPGDPLDNWAVSDVLLPAGYREGMTMCLRTPDGRVTGVINLSTDSRRHPSDVATDAIASLCSTLGNLTDPAGTARWLSMLLGSGTRAVGVNPTGEIVPLPGMAAHPLLERNSELLQVARGFTSRGSWGSFVWAEDADCFKVVVIPCRGDESLSSVVSIDEIDIRPLSHRELEVLTLAAEGLSNQDIGELLVITSRTVATHLEHILAKLEVPNRAAAAAYALREGLVLGRVRRPGAAATGASVRLRWRH